MAIDSSRGHAGFDGDMVHLRGRPPAIGDEVASRFQDPRPLVCLALNSHDGLLIGHRRPQGVA
jgi:hypothetical protein